MLDRALVDLLTQAPAPLSAYDLAAGLRKGGRNMAVMSIYRALDRLCARDMVEKVQTLAAYRIKDVSDSILTICTSCGRTRPLPAGALRAALHAEIDQAGFSLRFLAIEAAGLCVHCRQRA
jgi:Fur family zinc uptake transcriptional regulator